jgi:hypothetical protein
MSFPLTSSFWRMGSTHDLSAVYCVLYQMVDWFWFFTDLTVLSFTVSRSGQCFCNLLLALVFVTRANVDGVPF